MGKREYAQHAGEKVYAQSRGLQRSHFPTAGSWEQPPDSPRADHQLGARLAVQHLLPNPGRPIRHCQKDGDRLRGNGNCDCDALARVAGAPERFTVIHLERRRLQADVAQF